MMSFTVGSNDIDIRARNGTIAYAKGLGTLPG